MFYSLLKVGCQKLLLQSYHLMMDIHSENHIIRWFHHCANMRVYLHIYRNLDSIAYYRPRLYDLLLLGHKPVHMVTVQNTIGNCNTLVSIYFLFLYIFLKMGFHYDGQAGLELLTSGDPTTSASQSARITDMSHHTWSTKQKFWQDMTVFKPRATLKSSLSNKF